MVRLAFALTAVVAALAPVARAQSLLDTFERDVAEFTLDNGMTFVVVQRRDAPVVSFFTYADVGAVDEAVGQTGLAHIFEHMAFKGTTSLGTADLDRELLALAEEEEAYLALRDARLAGSDSATVAPLDARFHALVDSSKGYVAEAEFQRILERAGAVGLNAFTNADATGYLYSLPANRLELWFATEADRFLNPVLREFYVERDVVMEERRLRTESNPQGRLVEEFLALAFQAHPYGRPVVGWASDLENVSRTEAEAFFRRYYGPNNLTAVLVGDVDPAEARRLAERYFAQIPRAPAPPRVPTVEPPQRGERRVTLVEGAQPILIAGFHRPNRFNPDDAAYAVLQDALSNGRTSRLYRALVEPGLALSAQMFNGLPGDKYPTLFGVFAVPNRGISPDSLEQAALAVLDAVTADGITADELARAKTRARAALVRGLDSNSGLAGQLAEYEAVTGDWRNLFRTLDEIENVTADDVCRVAAATFRPENRTVAVMRTTEPAGGGQ